MKKLRRSSRIVPGVGPTDPGTLMLVGEGPGRREDEVGKPFVGASGQVLNDLLARAEIARSNVYVTNLCKYHIFRDLDPTPEEISADSPILRDEIKRINPDLIVTLGAVASRTLLQTKQPMEILHGLLHMGDPFGRPKFMAVNRPILPVYHPAAGLHDTDMLAAITWDFEQVGKYANGLCDLSRPHDAKPIETELVPVSEIAADAFARRSYSVAIDTEFDPRTSPPRPWGLSITHTPGRAAVVYADDAEGLITAHLLAEQAHHIYIHNLLADLPVLDQLLPDLDLRPYCLPESQPRVIDTMVLAYHLAILPQGLKALTYRLAGAQMGSFEDLVRPVQLEMALEWLQRANTTVYDPPSEQAKVDEATGKLKFTKPWTLNRRIKRILGDCEKRPEATDPTARWRNIDTNLRWPAEAVHGRFPYATVFEVDQDRATQYAAEDADATIRIASRLLAMQHAAGLDDIFDVDMGALTLVSRMQEAGMPADVAALDTLAEQARDRRADLQRELETLVGHKLNPNSPDQVAELLFDELGLMPGGLTSTGKRSTSKKVLTPYRATHPVVEKILLFKELLKIETAFCATIVRRVDYGRVHANIRATRTKTGRLATTDPNLLAIPVRTAEGRKVRYAFIAPEGYLFGAFDLNQIEMRVMAHCARDEALLEIYNRSPDEYPKHERCVHRMTASAVYGVRAIDVTELQRTMAKSTGFGIIMGITGVGLAAQLSLYGLDGHTVDDCDRFIEEWLRLHVGVYDFQLHQRALARRHGYVKDIYGRRYLLPGATSSVSKVREEALRQSHALVIQGGAQGAMKVIMRELEYEVLPELVSAGVELQPLLQVHDEVVFLAEEGSTELVREAVLEVFQRDRGWLVPVEASGDFAPSWGELEK